MADQSIERVLSIFDEINKVPRQSLHLEKIHPWLMEWGRSHGFETVTDEAQNILIRVPASPGFENAPTVVLQGHMDMVCEKRPGVEHDFQTDPIVSYRDGEWLRAEGTTLGADNAIALALFFDLVTDEEACYPALEILITSDEETGLVGAQELNPDFLMGKVLLNVDSEDEGIFTIGCAGGLDTNLSLPVPREEIPQGYLCFSLEVGGLEGGHSGVEIHVGKANANVLLLRALRKILDEISDARVGELNGGTAHNAIPREAQSIVAVPKDAEPKLRKVVADLESVLKIENAAIEKNLFLKLCASEAPTEGLFEPAAGSRLIDSLRLVPHGVKRMSPDIEGLVDTSMNFAVLKTEGETVKILTNRRSSMMTYGDDFSEIMFGLARLCGGTYETGNFYLPWEPAVTSDVLDRSKRIWKSLFDKEPLVDVTHAGLECGAIGAKYPEMDMISFGPTILQPHSPDERLHIPSVGRVGTFLRELLLSYRD